MLENIIKNTYRLYWDNIDRLYTINWKKEEERNGALIGFDEK